MSWKYVVDWRIFGILLSAGLLATGAIFPYIITTQASILRELPASMLVVIVVSLFQTLILLSVGIFFGLWAGHKVGLGAPLLSCYFAQKSIQPEVRSLIMPATAGGVLTAVLIVILDAGFGLLMEPLSNVPSPVWQRFLGAFYGGVVEELLLRLFLMTVLVWGLWRLLQPRQEKPSAAIFWTAVLLASVVFGLGHLPATAAIVTITPIVVARAIVLNGIGGVIFGWLYWKRGIEAAILAHFIADIVLLIVIPILLQW